MNNVSLHHHASVFKAWGKNFFLCVPSAVVTTNLTPTRLRKARQLVRGDAHGFILRAISLACLLQTKQLMAFVCQRAACPCCSALGRRKVE